jgi:hypothetical protein
MRFEAEQELMRSPELYQRYLTSNYKLPIGEDPRLTPIGGFLRALSIDELQHLLNVFRGEIQSGWFAPDRTGRARKLWRVRVPILVGETRHGRSLADRKAQ